MPAGRPRHGGLLGHRVTVRDVVPERVEALVPGEMPIHEKGLTELCRRNRDRLRYTLDIGDVIESAGIVFVCVGTPRCTRATPTSRPSGGSWTSSQVSKIGSCSL